MGRVTGKIGVTVESRGGLRERGKRRSAKGKRERTGVLRRKIGAKWVRRRRGVGH